MSGGGRRLEERARTRFEVVVISQVQPIIEWALKQKARQLPQDDRARRWFRVNPTETYWSGFEGRGGPKVRAVTS